MFRFYIIFLFAKIVCGFNIEGNNPALIQENVQTGNNGQRSNFFGYEIKFGFGSDDALNFVVGSPKANLTSGRGKIHTCRNPDFTSENLSCTTVPSPKGVDSASGVSLSVHDNLDILACYPNMLFNCIDQQFVPGFCYRSTNEGLDWQIILPDNESVCPTASNSDLDLVFLLDGSSSVGTESFEIVKDWVEEVSRQFSIANGSTQIGIIQYSTFLPFNSLDNQRMFRTEIELGSITDRNTFNMRVENITYLMGLTYTAKALNRSVMEFQTSERFGNPNTSKALVLLTDGRASDSLDLPTTASFVRSLGIRVFAVGVGDANVKQLQEIATGGNTNESVYFVDNFDALNGIAGELQEVIRNFALEGGSGSGNTSPSSDLELGQKGFVSRLSRKSKKAIVVYSTTLGVSCQL